MPSYIPHDLSGVADQLQRFLVCDPTATDLFARDVADNQLMYGIGHAALSAQRLELSPVAV